MTTLYFLPGASGNTLFWQPVIECLESLPFKKYHIHYPGFFNHPANDTIHNFDQLSDYVLNEIKQPSILIAQSMGGLFAIRAALEKPNLIQALVLVATSGGIDLSDLVIKDWKEAYLVNDPSLPKWFTETSVNYQN